MKPTRFSFPTKRPNVLAYTLFVFMMFSISLDQAVCLASSREILNVLVFISHQKIDLLCSNFPSPSSFLIEIAQSLWIGSCGETGRKSVWITRGTASRARGIRSGLSIVVVIMSSM